MSHAARSALVICCTIPMCGCYSRNLGVPEWKLLDQAVPEDYVIAESPSETFRVLRQAVADTPQARLLVSDEPSGLMSWLVRAETKEERQSRKQEDLGEPLLTVGTDGWKGAGAFGPAQFHGGTGPSSAMAEEIAYLAWESQRPWRRVRWNTPDFAICSVRIRPDDSGSRVQMRRTWWNNGQLIQGMPQAWVFESEVLARAGLRVSEANSSD